VTDGPPLRRRRLLALLGAGVASSGPGRAASAVGGNGSDDDDPPRPTRLVADDRDGKETFGRAVALDGSTAVVGDPYDERSEGRGSAYAFERADGEWRQRAKLSPDDDAEGQQFGYRVALAGGVAVVGAPGDGRPDAPRAGSASVFRESDGEWRRAARLAPGGSTDRFGISVATDGSRVLVGATLARGADGERRGAAYAFERSGGTWREAARLVGDGGDGPAPYRFGTAVALDGSTAVVGAPVKDDDVDERETGSTYAFERADGEWRRSTLPAPGGDRASGQFGGAAAVDGTTVLVGDDGADPSGTNSGAAVAYGRSDGEWREEGVLVAEDGDGGDGFGGTVAVEGDRALVAAPLDGTTGESGEGAAYVLDRTPTGWRQRTKLVSGTAGTRAFGHDASLDGDRALVGAPYPAEATLNDYSSGQAYAFDLPDGSPSPSDRPVAAFSHAPRRPAVGERVVLDAGASRDPDGPVWSYRWDLDDDARLERRRGERVAVTFDAPGPHDVSLRVSDADGFATRRTRTIVVDVDADGGGPGPVVGDSPPTDPDGDGLYEDVDGDGEAGVGDVVALYDGRDAAAPREHPAAFDFSGDLRVGLGDVVALFDRLFR
jgi:PKD repeat protein